MELWAPHVVHQPAWARTPWPVEVARQLQAQPAASIVASVAKTLPDLATTRRISSTHRMTPTPRDRVLLPRTLSKPRTLRAQQLRQRRMRTRRNLKSRRRTRKRRRRLLTLTTQNQTMTTTMTLTSPRQTVTRTQTIQRTARIRSARLSEPNATRNNLERHQRPIDSLLPARRSHLHLFSLHLHKLHPRSQQLQLNQM